MKDTKAIQVAEMLYGSKKMTVINHLNLDYDELNGDQEIVRQYDDLSVFSSHEGPFYRVENYLKHVLRELKELDCHLVAIHDNSVLPTPENFFKDGHVWQATRREE